MFAAMNINQGKKNYLKVDLNNDPVYPFCLTLDMAGAGQIRVHLTSLEAENLFYEASHAIQEYDRRNMDEKIKEILEP